MAIDERYVPAFSIEEVIIDKDTGAPLAGGQVFFRRDDNRSIPKNVHQITGSPPDYSYTPLPNPMTLNAAGSFEDAAGNPVVPYFLPYTSLEPNADIDLYYIVVESALGVPQFTRVAVPHLNDSIDPTIQDVNIANELSNPQFIKVNFNPSTGVTHTFSGASNEVKSIGPDWDLVVTGTGTVVVNQVSIAGNLNVITNPPYVLDIQASGSFVNSNVRLRQRLSGNAGIWTSEFIAGHLIAASQDAGTHTITMRYESSNGGPNVVIGSVSVDSGTYQTLASTVSLAASTSTQSAPDAYVDIVITLPPNGHVRVSSIQVVGMETNRSIVLYDTETQNRQIDHLFHSYFNSIILQPKDNILVGWDFGLNPSQFRSKSIANLTAQTQYIADQTIVHQQNNNSLQAGFSTDPLGYLHIASRSAVAQGRFAVIQYLDATSVRPYWAQTLSMLARIGFASTASPVTPLTIKARLIYRTSLPGTLSGSRPIVSFGAVEPTFAAGWTSIAPRNDPTYTLTNNKVATDYVFEGFELPTLTSNAAMIGIVIYTTSDMSATPVDNFYFKSCNLVRNDFAIDVNPKSFDQTLKECQFYYEKSFNMDVIPGSGSSTAGHLIRPINHYVDTNDVNAYVQAFGVEFKNIKRTSSPLFTTYVDSGNGIGNVTAEIDNTSTLASSARVLANEWTQRYLSQLAVAYSPAHTPAIVTHNVGSPADIFEYKAFINFGYTCDARLGLVT